MDMADERQRMQIALIAARMMYFREEKEYFTSKRKAARQLGVDGRYRPKDLPSNREIREQILSLATIYEGETRKDNLKDMRLAALRMMRTLNAFRPRVIGSTLTGHIRHGSDIDLHVFSDHLSAVTTVLEDAGLRFTVERKRVIKHGEERHFTHLHVPDRFDFELTLYDASKFNYPFKSSITGKLIERATVDEFVRFLEQEYPGIDLEADIERTTDFIDRFELYRSLLLPLGEVKQSPRFHPEGDALYHSLQVFDLATRHRPWDEEFLTAALLHDVGKAIDPADHVSAGLQALEGTITDRTAFLIGHHMDAHALRDGTMGHRAAIRLRAHDDFEDLELFGELDRKGRVPGALVPTVEESLAEIRELAMEDERG
jgi:predicted nucleotidyltransferase